MAVNQGDIGIFGECAGSGKPTKTSAQNYDAWFCRI
jgi:hypothetical protein